MSEALLEVAVFSLVLVNVFVVIISFLLDKKELISSSCCAGDIKKGCSNGTNIVLTPRSLEILSTQDCLFLIILSSSVLFFIEIIARCCVLKRKLTSQPLDLADSFIVVAVMTSLLACLCAKANPLITDTMSLALGFRLIRVVRLINGSTSQEKKQYISSIDFHKREEVFYVEKVNHLEHRLGNYEREVAELRVLIARATASHKVPSEKTTFHKHESFDSGTSERDATEEAFTEPAFDVYEANTTTLETSNTIGFCKGSAPVSPINNKCNENGVKNQKQLYDNAAFCPDELMSEEDLARMREIWSRKRNSSREGEYPLTEL